MARLARLATGMVAAWGLVLPSPAVAQQGDDTGALNAQVIKLYRLKRSRSPSCAGELGEGAGPDDPDAAPNNLAELYRGQGRYAEAEPL